MRFISFILLFIVIPCGINAQTFVEGPDLSNTLPGDTFTFSGPFISISGEMNTPTDGVENFVIELPFGCQIDSVTYSILDPSSVGVNGYFQFGSNNQESYSASGFYSFNAAGQFPTVPFPVSGPNTYQCVAQANIAFQSVWHMVFYGSCTPCIDPDIPSLSVSSDSVCQGDSVEINISGNLNSATVWVMRTDSCTYFLPEPIVGNSVKFIPSETKTYFIRGEGGCVVPGKCDSISIVVSDSVDASVTQSGVWLMANMNNASYQWVNCDNAYAPIAGETDQSCNICQHSTGNYAVIVSDGFCSDTSDCFQVVTSGISENIPLDFRVYQTENEIIIESYEAGSFDLKVYNLKGQVILNSSHSNEASVHNNFSPGLYLFYIENKFGVSLQRMVIE
ncbi:MAG: T9SS type A sorting domain-containing protein [Chitinophagales bacterium]|nr:T9SS type A sorting domain-containing protein [Chitinophagales bacterium]